MSLNKKNTEKQEITILPVKVENKPQESSFPIVGIGASAGGLAAFEAFFSGMPADVETGMAFVLVQHLSPEYKSILPNIISRYTSMKVFEVTNGMEVRPDSVYVIPPDCNMTFLNGVLELVKPASPTPLRLPIDMFFRSLALNQKERAIGIVLSGTGNDGTLGVRAIKGEGGMVMVQTPNSTEYDGMPRSAIGTGLVDYELLPAEMPARLVAYVSHSFSISGLPSVCSVTDDGNLVNKIFSLLHAHTGHDFSQYKMTSISRRIERRMALQQITAMDKYVEYLKQTPAEVEALFRDMLIGVTNFFRDPKAFEELEKRVIPELFVGKNSESIIRIWASGCSTGEEAYSIAILLAEYQASIRRSFKVQLFATDIDSNAIAIARAGLYPANIAADVSPVRLSRFFTETDDNFWRINKSIRDMVIFSEHNIIRDPPFSKLDLISCRNLMIYLNQKLQKQIFPRFHYALNPNGFLFLGTSETTGELIDLFSTIDNKMKIYQRKEGFTSLSAALPAWSRNPVTAIMAGLTHQDPVKVEFPIQRPMRSLIENALLQVMPAALLVNSQGDIFHIYGRTGMFLEPMQGDVATSNILKMAREGLLHELTLTLNRAVTTKQIVHCHGIRVRTNGDFITVNLVIRPVIIDKEDSTLVTGSLLYLVTLEAMTQETETSNKPAGERGADAELEAMKLALLVKEEYLQVTREELQTSNEEFQSSNEEMQSMNEELHSTNEELETSREELQSVNEELCTVNSELQNKVAELSKANNEINNLLSGTGIATVFVDHQLRILNFTPSISMIINLIPTDVGRPIAHLVSNLISYDSLVADIQAVLDTLIPKEVKVQTKEDRFYRMRISPYLTLNKAIEGAVITLVDITNEEKARESLRKANEELRLAVVVRDSYDAITVHDMNGGILAWNPGAVRMYGWSEAEALSMTILDRIPESLKKEEMFRLHQLCHAEILEPYFTRRVTKEGSIMEVSIISTPLVNKVGHVYAIATTERKLMKQLTTETDNGK
ncbi:MAG: PAS domain-containing protein [Desulfamplus sp.]|nr:PAS domain-containing protein [Desulfamplus sp.]